MYVIYRPPFKSSLRITATRLWQFMCLAKHYFRQDLIVNKCTKEQLPLQSKNVISRHSLIDFFFQTLISEREFFFAKLST